MEIIPLSEKQTTLHELKALKDGGPPKREFCLQTAFGLQLPHQLPWVPSLLACPANLRLPMSAWANCLNTSIDLPAPLPLPAHTLVVLLLWKTWTNTGGLFIPLPRDLPQCDHLSGSPVLGL